MNSTLLPRIVRGSLIAALSLTLIPTLTAQSSANISVSMNSGTLRRTIPTDFLGLSFEMSSIEATNNSGAEWFSSSSASGAYGSILKKMGVENIRIGGNSSERTPYATTTDAAAVEAFASGIGANLIWSVPVKQNYNQSTSVSFVQSMWNTKSNNGYAFPLNIEVGNEPDNDDSDGNTSISYSTWQGRYDGFSSAFRSINGSILTTGPSSAGCCTYPNGLETDSKYTGSLKSTIGDVTVHNYPEGDSASFSSINAGDTALLSSGNAAKYQTFYNNFNDNASNNGYTIRIEETNSAYGGSNNGVTNTYAAALWAMDYFCYMAYNTNMGGMNLHTGPIGSNSGSYNAISPVGVASSYTLEAPGYGLWAFHYGSQGQPLQTTISNPSGANVTAYGLLETNGGETLHLINKTFGSGAVNVTASITPGGTYTHAQVIVLKQSSNDVTATTGITFGGASMDGSGGWTGGYGAEQTFSGTFTFTLPATQAAIVHFY
jgi:hypothetical protein